MGTNGTTSGVDLAPDLKIGASDRRNGFIDVFDCRFSRAVPPSGQRACADRLGRSVRSAA
jgi:hypothetical protein